MKRYIYFKNTFTKLRGQDRHTVKRYYPTPHFVPEGISSSMRDFIILVFNFEVFHIKFSEK